MIRESYINSHPFNKYYIQEQITDSDITSDDYRNTFCNDSGDAGWERDGTNQLQILLRNGLSPSMKFLEVGCGYLRGGSHIINYLEPYNYYGLEVNRKMLFIGLNNELRRKNLLHKVREENFILTDHFDLSSFNKEFDFGFANSVFTALPLNHLIYFLKVSQNVFKTNAKLIISFWICPEDKDITEKISYSNNQKTYCATYLSAPFFIEKEDLYSICNRPDINWSVKEIEGFRQMNQSFFLFERL